ncbi:MAG: ABC transporter permease [Acidobacteriia bacterium]|nr:ABC transporter permease [Terriglobia bacterium]
MTGLIKDLRYALRQLRKTPGLTFAATLMLALGIGVNTAIFAVFYQVLLRTLPVYKPSELVILKESSGYETGRLDIWGGDPEMFFAYPAYQALREGDNHSLKGLAASTVAPATIVSDQTTDRSLMQLVSGNYFTLLGVQPLLGRVLIPDDDIYHAGRAVTVVSESYWRSHFGGDLSILNQQIEINASPFTIVGVARHDGLMDSVRPALFLPINTVQRLVPGKEDFLIDPLHRWLNIVGRLAPGVTREQAEAQLNVFWWNWRRDVLKARKDNIPKEEAWLETHLSVSDGARGIPLLQGTLGEPLTVLETMAFLVLIIACANVASLLLAKSVSRSRELAVHAALGGSRRRIMQKLVSEGVLLGLIGVGFGLLLGSLALKFLLGILPSTNTLRETLTAQLSWSTIAICAIGGIVTSLTFSIAPAILSSRINLLSALHPQSDSAPGRDAKLRNFLVAGEIALSLVSLSGAAVFGWSLHELRNMDPGFDTSRHMLTFRVDASVLGKSGPQVRNEYAEMTQAIRQQPGVRNVAYLAEGLIDNSGMGNNVTVAGYSEKGDEPHVSVNWMTPSFLSTMNIPLLAGRIFTAQDSGASPKVAIVDEAFVKCYFAGDVEKALRGRFGFGSGNHVPLDIQIVGVIPTIRATSLQAAPPIPFVYLSYDQTYSATEPDPSNHPASFYISTAGDAGALAASVRSLIHARDRNLPVTRLETMEEHLNGVIVETRMASGLSVAMGGLALLLAAIGLYGLLAFIVTQRTREIGIRMALGANREQIARVVAKRLARLVSAGILLGGLLAWAGVHVLATRDANLADTPIWLFSAVTALLLTVMFLAAVLPARRAARVDPMVALRYE